LIAEHGQRAQWVRNLSIEPAVQVRVGGRAIAARARVVDGVAEAALAEAIRRLSEKKYRWGDGLAVELRPV